jgi:hypothetical protein
MYLSQSEVLFLDVIIFVVLSSSAANDSSNGGNDSMGSFRLARALQRKMYTKSLEAREGWGSGLWFKLF